MSTWRRKALELFPDLRKEIQQRDTTIYTVFFELLPRCRTAHKDGQIEELAKIYAYAEWCLWQKNHDVSNAAGVSFYEHLGDYPETTAEMHKWVKPKVFKAVAGLLEHRMGEAEFATLRKQFKYDG